MEDPGFTRGTSSLSFFQPLLPGFLTGFKIPRKFRTNFYNSWPVTISGSEISVKLKSDSGGGGAEEEDGEKTWCVKVDVLDDWRFKDGWEQFACDHGLSVGFFVVFRLVDAFVFLVSVFELEPTCRISYSTSSVSSDPAPNCIVKSLTGREDNNGFQPAAVKVEEVTNSTAGHVGRRPLKRVPYTYKPKKPRPQYPPPAAIKREKYDHVFDLEEITLLHKEKGFVTSGNPYFITIVKPYCLRWPGMLFPMAFAKAHNISHRWCNMILITELGKYWKLHLRHRKAGKNQVYLSAGWGEFHIDNKLRRGDTVVFELISAGSTPVMKFYNLSCFLPERQEEAN